MKKRLSTLGIALLVGSTGLALGDDFAREGDDRQQKDRLEGREPPALQVTAWMNTGGRSLELASLKGKVVVLDFWGTW